MLEHHVPKGGLETRASPFNKVTADPLLPDQDRPVAGGGASCPGVMGCWLPLAVFVGGILVHCCQMTLSKVCAKSCEGLCKKTWSTCRFH